MVNVNAPTCLSWCVFDKNEYHVNVLYLGLNIIIIQGWSLFWQIYDSNELPVKSNTHVRHR